MRGCKLFLELQGAKHLPIEFHKRKLLTGAALTQIMGINKTPPTFFLMFQRQA